MFARCSLKGDPRASTHPIVADNASSPGLYPFAMYVKDAAPKLNYDELICGLIGGDGEAKLIITETL